MWTYLNQAYITTWQELPINVIENGGGSYTLSWTVPAGATQFQIKYSSKTIVEWLGFNKDTRAYQYAPALYTAFFAANNITNIPVPAITGTIQTITLTGLPTGQQFAAKCLVENILVPTATAAPAPPAGLMRTK